jgi:hypothetical protein
MTLLKEMMMRMLAVSSWSRGFFVLMGVLASSAFGGTNLEADFELVVPPKLGARGFEGEATHYRGEPLKVFLRSENSYSIFSLEDRKNSAFLLNLLNSAPEPHRRPHGSFWKPALDRVYASELRAIYKGEAAPIGPDTDQLRRLFMSVIPDGARITLAYTANAPSTYVDAGTYRLVLDVGGKSISLGSLPYFEYSASERLVVSSLIALRAEKFKEEQAALDRENIKSATEELLRQIDKK